MQTQEGRMPHKNIFLQTGSIVTNTNLQYEVNKISRREYLSRKATLSGTAL